MFCSCRLLLTDKKDCLHIDLAVLNTLIIQRLSRFKGKLDQMTLTRTFPHRSHLKTMNVIKYDSLIQMSLQQRSRERLLDDSAPQGCWEARERRPRS